MSLKLEIAQTLWRCNDDGYGGFSYSCMHTHISYMQYTLSTHPQILGTVVVVFLLALFHLFFLLSNAVFSCSVLFCFVHNNDEGSQYRREKTQQQHRGESESVRDACYSIQLKCMRFSMRTRRIDAMSIFQWKFSLSRSRAWNDFCLFWFDLFIFIDDIDMNPSLHDFSILFTFVCSVYGGLAFLFAVFFVYCFGFFFVLPVCFFFLCEARNSLEFIISNQVQLWSSFICSVGLDCAGPRKEE